MLWGKSWLSACAMDNDLVASFALGSIGSCIQRINCSFFNENNMVNNMVKGDSIIPEGKTFIQLQPRNIKDLSELSFNLILVFLVLLEIFLSENYNDFYTLSGKRKTLLWTFIILTQYQRENILQVFKLFPNKFSRQTTLKNIIYTLNMSAADLL